MKFEKEITVEVDCSIDELMKILEKNGFKIIEEYDLKDIYMIDKNYKFDGNYLDVLKRCILIRNIIEEDRNRKVLTYKYKEYNELEEIVKQGRVDCEIKSLDEAYSFLNTIGYKELISIDDHMIVCCNEKTELSIQLVNDKHIYIEMEEDSHHVGRVYTSVEEMIDDFNKYNIPIKGDNYFVKKALIELKEVYGDKFFDNENKKYIGMELDVVMDRPFGCKHPKHGFIYPVNYGYIPGTVSGDGEELDCYVLGVFEPIEKFRGKCIAIIHRTNDNDDKLVVVPECVNYSDDAIEALVEFQEKYFEYVIIRR